MALLCKKKKKKSLYSYWCNNSLLNFTFTTMFFDVLAKVWMILGDILSGVSFIMNAGDGGLQFSFST